MAKITYNERSWAIDVISEIGLHLANKSWHFKYAISSIKIGIKKLYQRAFRKTHVADYDCWSLSLTMAPYILRHLKTFRAMKRMGYPIYFSNWSEDIGLTKEEYEADSKFLGGEEKGWDKVIDEMIFAFEFMLADEYVYDKRKPYFKNFVSKYGKDWTEEIPENLTQLKVYKDEKGDTIIASNPKEDYVEILDSPLSKPHYYNSSLHIELTERAEKGFELFGRFYWNLWD